MACKIILLKQGIHFLWGIMSKIFDFGIIYDKICMRYVLKKIYYKYFFEWREDVAKKYSGAKNVIIMDLSDEDSNAFQIQKIRKEFSKIIYH